MMADGWGQDAKSAARQTPLRVLVWHGSNAHSHPEPYAQKHPPFFSVLPSSPCVACGLMDGGRIQRVAAPQTPLRVLVGHGSNAHSHPLKHHRPCHPPTHSSASATAGASARHRHSRRSDSPLGPFNLCRNHWIAAMMNMARLQFSCSKTKSSSVALNVNVPQQPRPSGPQHGKNGLRASGAKIGGSRNWEDGRSTGK
eukprot:scaffold18543_cov140-Isochrysis_galbana.AAC.5